MQRMCIQGTNGDEDRSKRQEAALSAIIGRVEVEVAHSQKCLLMMKLETRRVLDLVSSWSGCERERSIVKLMGKAH